MDPDAIVKMFEEGRQGFELTPAGVKTIRRFLVDLSQEDVAEAMMIALSRIPDGEQTWRYFCGVCWNRIKGSGVVRK